MKTLSKQEVDDKPVVEEQEKETTPEKVTIYRVAYNGNGEFHGFDYHLSKLSAHIAAEYEGGTGSTRVDELEVELSPRGICSALNEYAIAWDPDGFDSWYPEKDYPGRNVTWQIWKGRSAEKEKAELLGSFGSFREADAFVRNNDTLEKGSVFPVVVENAS